MQHLSCLCQGIDVFLREGTITLWPHIQEKICIHCFRTVEHLQYILSRFVVSIELFVVTPGMRLKGIANLFWFILVKLVDLTGHLELLSYPGISASFGSYEIFLPVGTLLEGNQGMGGERPDQSIGGVDGEEVGSAVV